jgi:hypothetical protein
MHREEGLGPRARSGTRASASGPLAVLLAVLLVGLVAGATPASAQWRADAGAHAILLYTWVDPVPGGAALDELRLVHPVVMASAANPTGTLMIMGMLNLEGATMPGGELTPGVFGEGFVDRRHPHTYLHELVVTGSLPAGTIPEGNASITLGKGFVPFGTDDPMSRPVLRYPVNHHFAQILERLVLIGAVRWRPLTVEGAVFNGDEPDRPAARPALDRFGDSWAARVTLRPAAGVEAQLSRAVVASPEHREGAGTTQRKWSVSGRWEGPVGGGEGVALAEWARTDEADGFFVFRTALVEGAWGRGAHRLHYRFERTERPEEERLADPFRSARPHHDDSNLGTTRWTIHTAGYAVALPAPRPIAGLSAMLELSRAGVRRLGGIFDPAQFYGRPSIWSASVGLRLDLGARMHRMGRYGAASTETESGDAPHHH